MNEFLESIIIEKFNPSRIIIGYDHHFGYKRKGNSKFLESKASEYGYITEVISKIGDEGEVYSSSRIRKLIKEGNVRRASYVKLDKYYGETFEIQFLERIRDEKKFNSSDNLIKQLNKDKTYCLNRIEVYKEEK